MTMEDCGNFDDTNCNNNNNNNEDTKDAPNGFVGYILGLLKDKDNQDDSSVEECINAERARKAMEAVGKEPRIMRKIIRHLTDPIDRKNIERVCKKYYSLCNEKNSYISLSHCERIRTQYITGEDHGYNFMVGNKEITLCILRTLKPDERDYRRLRRLFEKYGPHMDTLSFMILSPGYYDVFKDLNCFPNIQTLKIDINVLQAKGIELFTNCIYLRPRDLHIVDLSHHPLRVIVGEKFGFPSSIKNFYFKSSPKCLKWLSYHMRNLPEKCFDSFYIHEYYFSKISTYDDKMSYFNILKFFKHVNYFTGDFICSQMDTLMIGTINKYNFNLTINICFCNDKFNENISKTPKLFKDICRKRGNALNNSSNRLLSQQEIYNNIIALIISDNYGHRRHYPFSNYELNHLKADVGRMKKLEKLFIDLHLFRTFPDFKDFCNSIRCELKCMRIGRCSTIMSYYLPEISKNFKKLEYLFLNDVGPYTNVTFRRILKIVNYLKGLKIVFNEYYNPKHILDDLEKKVNGKGVGVLDWPDIDYLDITFTCSIKEYHEKILEIERFTPRRRGKFLIKRGDYNGKSYYHIIIQRRTGLFDKVETLFDCNWN